jgi:hypothetical protein
MRVKYIKIIQKGGQAIVTETEASMPRNGKTIIRKQPYRQGLCYQHRKKKATGKSAR